MTTTWIRDIQGFTEFDEYVLNASHTQPVLVDFWADWCGPCLFLAPVLKQVIEGYQGQVLLAKVDTEEDECIFGDTQDLVIILVFQCDVRSVKLRKYLSSIKLFSSKYRTKDLYSKCGNKLAHLRKPHKI